LRLALKAAAILVAVPLLWACRTAPPSTPAPSITPLPTTIIRGTLPPTWTPTNTNTPLPPSETNTPHPTLTPTATLGPDNICDGFDLYFPFPNGDRFGWDKVVPYTIQSGRTDVVIQLQIVHRRTGEQVGGEIPGGQFAILQMPVNILPHPGLYDWTITVHSDELGDFCAQEGYFFALPPTEQPEATPDVETTAEP